MDLVLYCRDEQTGDHLVTHEGREQRFASRAEALAVARRLAEEIAAAQAERPD